MIIRNPYGFFARHHKIIHLILLIPLVYLIFAFGDIAEFFQDYVSAGYFTPETSIVESYVNGVLFLIVFALALANGIIFLILGSKKKNNIVYGINTIYFLILLIALLLFGSSMSSIEKENFDATFANFVRDCSKLSYFPLYIIAAVYVAKGVGFNIRTLRFDAGNDLKISEEDEEDVEINLGGEDSSFKRNFVHMLRELKYYVIENKFVVSCIGVVLILIFGYTIYKEVEINNKTYAINQEFKLSNYSLSIKESYITDVDYHGTTIDKEKYYLVIKMGIQNTSKYPAAINKGTFKIVINGKDRYPSYDKGSRFIDFGALYQGESILAGDGRDYVFVYELTKKEIKASYQIDIVSSLTQKNQKIDAKYKRITVKPQNITKSVNLGEVKKGQEMKLKDTTLGDTTYKLNDYKLVDSYQYTYEQCNNKTNTCYKITDTIIPSSSGSMLLVLDDEIKWDEKTEYYKNGSKDFYVDFCTLKYKFKNINYGENSDLISGSSEFKNITPLTLKDKTVYEVPNTLSTAENININIKIRNKNIKLIVK
ncbi:MAG TPA: hypothetical protein DCE23_08670 [Firmicutes bacterium]|nr:hypothetical protein [Bacillota bacterium]